MELNTAPRFRTETPDQVTSLELAGDLLTRAAEKSSRKASLRFDHPSGKYYDLHITLFDVNAVLVQRVYGKLRGNPRLKSSKTSKETLLTVRTIILARLQHGYTLAPAKTPEAAYDAKAHFAADRAALALVK